MYILCFDFQVKKTFKTYLSFCAACFVLFLSNIHLSLKKTKAETDLCYVEDLRQSGLL